MSKVSKVHVRNGTHDLKDAHSVCTISPAPYFPTLDSFVRATDINNEAVYRGYSFYFRDTGGWGPLGSVNQWYRCLMIRYQNAIGSPYPILGTGIFAYGGRAIYIGEITGTEETSYTAKWFALKDDGTIRKALPETASLLNGHIVGGSTGWIAMTAHASGDVSKQYRIQLNNNGGLQFYTSTDGGSSWTAGGSYVKTDMANVWTSKALTANASYVNNLGNSNCYYNATLKLATVSINCSINTVAASGQVLISGFPKSLSSRATFCISQGTATAPVARVYINQSGQLVADGAVPATGWYNGSVTYPYSALP